MVTLKRIKTINITHLNDSLSVVICTISEKLVLQCLCQASEFTKLSLINRRVIF